MLTGFTGHVVLRACVVVILDLKMQVRDWAKVAVALVEQRRTEVIAKAVYPEAVVGVPDERAMRARRLDGEAVGGLVVWGRSRAGAWVRRDGRCAQARCTEGACVT
jgi:hypothetical protein